MARRTPLPDERETYPPLFADRRDAGRRLAALLAPQTLDSPIVVALPRGGVPVAVEVAAALSAPLELLLVRKLGAPGEPEYGLGAVVDGIEPQVVLNEEAMQVVQPSPDYLEAETQRQLREIERRRQVYLGVRPPLALRDRDVIVVDDGIATGGTVRAALKGLRQAGAGRIVLAVPMAPAPLLETLRAEADAVVCVLTPEHPGSVGRYYQRFPQLDDAEVIALLAEANAALPRQR